MLARSLFCAALIAAALPVRLVPQAREIYRVNLAGVTRSSAADLAAMLPARVFDHVDGDTVKVTVDEPAGQIRHAETVRLLGVDTPETVHPRREVEQFGREASDFTKSKLLGKEVLLAFDWDLRDAFGRVLAYVYLPDGTCHNAELIRQGFAHAYTRFPFQFMDEFRALEREAREQRSGVVAVSRMAGGLGMGKALKPGEKAPRSGQYQQIGPKGGKGKEVTVTKGEPMPPAPTKGSTYKLKDPTKNKSGRG